MDPYTFGDLNVMSILNYTVAMYISKISENLSGAFGRAYYLDIVEK